MPMKSGLKELEYFSQIVILGIIIIQIIKTVRKKIKQKNETERTKIEEKQKEGQKK